MKNYLTSIILLVSSSAIFAQEIPEIKMKNELVYYEFKHTLKNEKTCISKYYLDADLKTLYKNQSVKTAKKKFIDYVYIFWAGGQLKTPRRNPTDPFSAQCVDTVANMAPLFSIALLPDMPLLSPTSALIYLIKVKTYAQSITAKVEVIFLSKTEYILKFKDFQYTIRTGRDFRSSVETQIPLGEVYKEFLNTEKKSKKAIEIFNAVNYFVNSSDEIYLKSLTECFQADEL